MSAARQTVTLVGLLTYRSFVPENIFIVQRNCSALDLVKNSVRCTADLLSNLVWTQAILEAGLNQNPMLK